MFKLSAGLGIVTALSLAGAALAGVAPPPPPPPAASASSEDTRFFAGLNWTFGSGGQSVEGILGVAHGSTDAGGDFTGAKASLHLKLDNGDVRFRKAKLTGLFGEPEVQGEAGIGYNFETGNFIGVAGVNGRYAHAGADIGFNGAIDGYIGVHTIGAFDGPTTIVTPPTTPQPTVVTAEPPS